MSVSFSPTSADFDAEHDSVANSFVFSFPRALNLSPSVSVTLERVGSGSRGGSGATRLSTYACARDSNVT